MAGGRFVASASFVRSDTGGALAPRTIACLGVIARTIASSASDLPLRGVASHRGERISCTWKIPPQARGKVFRAALVGGRGAARAKLLFWRRIR